MWVWNPSAFPPSLGCQGKAGFCHKDWLIKGHPSPFSLDPQVNPKVLQTVKPQIGAMQLKLHICLGWKARLLSGTSELVLWVQLPSVQGWGWSCQQSTCFTRWSHWHKWAASIDVCQGRETSFLFCAVASTCLCFSLQFSLPWIDQECSLCLTLTVES